MGRSRGKYGHANPSVRAFGAAALTHVSFALVVNKLDNWEPRGAVVNIVSEARGVDDRELDLELAFFELSFDDFYFCELVQLLEMTLIVVFRRGKLSREKGVDERGFAQPRFTWRNQFNKTISSPNEQKTHQQP